MREMTNLKRIGPYLGLLLLVAAGFSVATVIQGRAEGWSRRGKSNNLLNVLFGEGRRLFANQFFIQADVSFHSGYYPSIFDQGRMSRDTRHLTAKEGKAAAEEHERQMQFLGPPRDWIERFGRHFMITEHTHLQGNNEREILPWLKMAEELDPQKIETYTVAAYWLRDLGKIKEAERFLREGLLNNPDNYELFLDLGRLYYENRHDAVHARRYWESALRCWSQQEAANKNPDLLKLDEIATRLARLDEAEGNLTGAIQFFELAKKASPNPQALQQQIEELKLKLKALPTGASPAAR